MHAIRTNWLYNYNNVHHREVVEVIINSQICNLDHMTYTEDTLSLLIERMPGIIQCLFVYAAVR